MIIPTSSATFEPEPGRGGEGGSTGNSSGMMSSGMMSKGYRRAPHDAACAGVSAGGGRRWAQRPTVSLGSSHWNSDKRDAGMATRLALGERGFPSDRWTYLYLAVSAFPARDLLSDSGALPSRSVFLLKVPR